MSSITTYIIAFLVYLTAGIIFNKIFYRERLDSNNYSVFNLSAIAEYILITIYLALVVFQGLRTKSDQRHPRVQRQGEINQVHLVP